jgi:Mn2+/Fe2+ NRAMP family transporter
VELPAADAFVPSWPTREAWATLVAILGTTISPYLFFWQASQEVEEEKAMGRRMLVQRFGATPRQLTDRRIDVGIGTFFSNLVMFFVILTTALTLHRHGATSPQSSREVAQGLRPLAGPFAEVLYTVGIVGVGLLAIPTLAGSSAYAFAETFGWRQGLDRKLRGARYFYGVIVLSTAVGIALDFLDVNPVRALYWTAILNGVLSPVPPRRNPLRGARPQADARTADLARERRGGRRRDAPDVRRRGRDVPPLAGVRPPSRPPRPRARRAGREPGRRPEAATPRPAS